MKKKLLIGSMAACAVVIGLGGLISSNNEVVKIIKQSESSIGIFGNSNVKSVTATSTSLNAADLINAESIFDASSMDNRTVTGGDYDVKNWIDAVTLDDVELGDGDLYYFDSDNSRMISNWGDYIEASSLEEATDFFKNLYIYVCLTAESGSSINFYSKISGLKNLASKINQTVGAIIEDNYIRLTGVYNAAFNLSGYLGIYVQGYNYYIFVDVSNPDSFSSITSGITATDETDGDITDRIKYTTDYPKDTNFSLLKTGTYPVNGSVSDNAGNTTNFNFNIYVMDYDAPNITNSTLSFTNSSLVSKNDVIDRIGIHDNYDSFENLTLNLTGYENYEANYLKGGTYNLNLTVSDTTGNSAEYPITINNSDVIKPVFSNVSGSEFNLTSGFITTTISTGGSINFVYIKSLLKATDETDGDITDRISVTTNEYFGHETETNSNGYRVIFTVSDTAGNSSELVLLIKTVDDISPIVKMGDQFYVSPTSPVNATQLYSFLAKTEMIPTGNQYLVSIEAVDYFENSNVNGVYPCTVTVTNLITTNTETTDFNLVVTNGVEEAPKKKESIFTKVLNKFKSFMKKVWDTIKKPFISLYSKIKAFIKKTF